MRGDRAIAVWDNGRQQSLGTGFVQSSVSGRARDTEHGADGHDRLRIAL
jgi:hypothetical protein